MTRPRLSRRRTSLLSAYTADMGQLISRRRAEASLRAAAMESAMANRAKTEFLANMSHELRTPLNAIIGFGDLIQKLKGHECNSGKPREYALHISHAGRYLLGIVSDILDISKIESGRFVLNVHAQSLSEIVDSCLALLRARIEQKKQTLTVRIPSRFPLVVADELRLKQILLNLLTNAHKFTGAGGKIIVIAKENEDLSVTIAVSDTGRGMTVEEISHALKPFTQIQSTYARDQEGTGLGLPIAKALVERHGGLFRVDSTPGVGTTVAFTLPARTAGDVVQKARAI